MLDGVSRIITADDVEYLETGPHRSGSDGLRAVADTFRSWATDRDEFELEAEVSRASLFVSAGEYYLLADDLELALTMHRLAVADGGAAMPDARVYLISTLMKCKMLDEANTLADDLRATRPTDPIVYLFMGEGFEVEDQLSRAERWFNMGLGGMMRGSVEGTEFDYDDLLIARRRVREAAGLSEDAMDADAATALADRQAP